MSNARKAKMLWPVRFLFENSLFLIGGALAALIWANLDPDVADGSGRLVKQGSYNRFIHETLVGGEREGAPGVEGRGEAPAEREEGHGEASSAEMRGASSPPHGGGGHGLTVHFLINDILMALFFAIAAKEVWESFLPGGALSNPRKAATPLLATLGGVIGPAAIYLTGAWMLNEWDALNRGWAIPCATDIAFSYLAARIIFGKGHPAIAFLLLLAIADDAVGLMILAVFYPTGEIHAVWLLLTAAAILTGFGFRKLRLQSFWWYLLIPGVMSWYSFHLAGVHPALGLVPIIPTLPHAHTDLGIFARKELNRHDTLNEFEHWWKNPVELILGLFGLVNAGVVMSSVGAGTWLVLVGLLVGKPLGITLFTWLAEKGFKLQIPGDMSYRHIISLGTTAGIGFTVALFVSTAAYPQPGPIQDSVKMGALMSFFAALLAFAVARALGVRRVSASGQSAAAHASEASASVTRVA